MIIDVHATAPAHGGECIARHEGRVVFVSGAIPGEHVRAEVTQRRSQLWRARTVDVLEPSPDRVPHIWPDAPDGAELGHIALPAQREWKTEVLRGTIRRIGGEALAESFAPFDLTVAPLPGETSGLNRRTRVEFVIDGDGRPAMYGSRSHDLHPLQSHPLADQRILDLGILDADAGWGRVWKPGDRVKAVAPSASQALIVCEGEAWLSPTDPADPTITEEVSIAGRKYTYHLDAAGFWQIHPEAPAVLADAVMEGRGVEESAVVVELFAGAGLFTVPLAEAVGARGLVRTLEGSEQAVNDARRNVAHWPHVRAEVADIDAEAMAEATAGADVVVADPPRAGLGQDGAAMVAGSPARRIVLVSCDPAAMARDVAAMRAAGREVVDVQAWDLFPHTHHMEIVTVLR